MKWPTGIEQKGAEAENSFGETNMEDMKWLEVGEGTGERDNPESREEGRRKPENRSRRGQKEADSSDHWGDYRRWDYALWKGWV